MPEPSTKQRGWVLFDRIVADAAHGGIHSNPWRGQPGSLRYEPDTKTLERLLGVPLLLDANTQSGVPALALDVWLSYELRRAGFTDNETWPRATHPRILPAAAADLVAGLPRQLRERVQAEIDRRPSITGVTSASASILGKNYFKQVDVIITGDRTGPELLISTKRMDSSYGKNAPNRIEESYGDAKNLRLRHPLAALGFVFGLRSDVIEKEPDTADWLIDLLGKLGQEEDAYHATCLVMMEYSDSESILDTGEPEDRAAAAGLAGDVDADEDTAAELPTDQIEHDLAALPRVAVRHDLVPEHLQAGRFLGTMVNRVLDTTPVTLHKEARTRRRQPLS